MQYRPLSTGLTLFDVHCGGLLSGDLLEIIGESGSGKTTWILRKSLFFFFFFFFNFNFFLKHRLLMTIMTHCVLPKTLGGLESGVIFYDNGKIQLNSLFWVELDFWFKIKIFFFAFFPFTTIDLKFSLQRFASILTHEIQCGLRQINIKPSEENIVKYKNENKSRKFFLFPFIF